MLGEEIKVGEDSFLRLLDRRKETTSGLLARVTELRKQDMSKRQSHEVKVKTLPDDDAAQLALRLITGEGVAHRQSGVLVLRVDTIMSLRSGYFQSGKKTDTVQAKKIYDKLDSDLPSDLKVVTRHPLSFTRLIVSYTTRV